MKPSDLDFIFALLTLILYNQSIVKRRFRDRWPALLVLLSSVVFFCMTVIDMAHGR